MLDKVEAMKMIFDEDTVIEDKLNKEYNFQMCVTSLSFDPT